MQISSVSSNSSPSVQLQMNARAISPIAGNKNNAERYELQDTFTAVLAEFGREGYESANPTKSDPPVDASIVAAWNERFDKVGRSAYLEVSSTNPQLKQDYGQILLDAYTKGGYERPTKFLETLTTDQLSTLQTIHRLADPIDPTQLQEEGALNLLIPPPAQVDFNRDGLTQIGIAQIIRFPDSSTSAEVRDAWDQATANLSPMERSQYALQMKLPTLMANIHLDSNGQFLYCSEPGDSDWTNPMASASYSYRAAVREKLDYLDAFKNQIPPDQYIRDQKFWTQFGDQLTSHGAA